MFKINSYTDLKVAYEILEIAYESGRSQKAADLKREMRAFFHRPVSERRIVQDDGIDGYTELLPLPEYIETMDEAVSYFEDYEYRHADVQPPLLRGDQRCRLFRVGDRQYNAAFI